MNKWRNNPTVFEINTWVWLQALSEKYQRPITLGNVPAEELERMVKRRFDALWLMGVWQRSPSTVRTLRGQSELHAAFSRILPDYGPHDIVGSPFAVHDYRVEPTLGGDEELASLRRRLRSAGLRLMLDFVPNHLALDHPFVTQHPEYLVQADPGKLDADPHNYFGVIEGEIRRVFAHGRDPLFDGWRDTVQLDYRQPGTRDAMSEILLGLAGRCDGVRCDMAMLVTRDVFLRTWGGQFNPPEAEFWPAAIRKVKESHPDFLMIAEVYWDLEATLLWQGFDYAYDKRLYDRLLSGDTEQARLHLRADVEYQRRLVRFVENHDEARAASAFGPTRSLAAAALTLTLPGLRLLFDGQLEGSRVKLPVQLARRPPESPDPHVGQFYGQLLEALSDPVWHEGCWEMLEPREAWGGNPTHAHFVAHAWEKDGERRLTVVNLSGDRAQCYLPLRHSELAGSFWYLTDPLNNVEYLRDGDQMMSPGLYLDVPGHGYHVFSVKREMIDPPTGVNHLCNYGEHKTPIYSTAWRPDGRVIASAGKGGRIRLWDADSCQSVGQIEGHPEEVSSLAWSPDGRTLASGASGIHDREVRLWEVESGELRGTLNGHTNNVLSLAWSPDGRTLASSSIDETVILWDSHDDWRPLVLANHTYAVNSLAWSPDGKTLASGGGDSVIYLWDAESRKPGQRIEERAWVASVAWHPAGSLLASGLGNGAVTVWNAETGRQAVILEGHTDRILCVAFSADGRLLASKSADNTVRLWNCETWKGLTILKGESGTYLSGLAFHPARPVLATRDDKNNVVRIWSLNTEAIIGAAPVTSSVHYTNAKVVLVGDTGAGKTCLARALMEEPFDPTLPSSNGMKVWPFRAETIRLADGAETIRETLLWDLAGQPEYQLIHQLFLDETALGIVLFNPNSPDNTFNGVGYWEKSLCRVLGPDCQRLLVAGRVDRAYPAVVDVEIDSYRREHGYSEFIATSAQTGQGVQELREAIARSIPWEKLPVTSSPWLWKNMRDYLLERSKSGDVLVRRSELREAFRAKYPRAVFDDKEFDTVISHAQARGLMWRLGFGDLVLLKPELLNGYASIVVRAARKHPEGLGVIPEGDVLKAKINLKDLGEDRIKDDNTERSLLHAVVELFLKREVALSEDGHLIFPSKYNRSRPKLPPFEIAYSFEGAIENIYATLIVRLLYSGLFERKEMWKNAAEFKFVGAGETCGFTLDNVDEGHGVLSIFFDTASTMDSKMLFLRFIHEHLRERAVPDTLIRKRIYRCPDCRREVKDEEAIRFRLAAGFKTLRCSYDEREIVLLDLLEEKFGDPELLERLQELEEGLEKNKTMTIKGKIDYLKESIGKYDVFLSYNSKDVAEVKEIARKLKDETILPWLDAWELLPGRPWMRKLEEHINSTNAAAVFFGNNGVGPWQQMEIGALLDQAVKKGYPVIPVLLSNAPRETSLPPFLNSMVCVDFREQEPDPLERLICGIRGQHY